MNGFLMTILTLMMIYKPGDIVAVPFPFVDRPDVKRRPALVLSQQQFNKSHSHTILTMITTGKKTSWNSDIPITDQHAASLPVPSVVRMKLFTLDNRMITKSIGSLHSGDWQSVQKKLQTEVLGG